MFEHTIKQYKISQSFHSCPILIIIIIIIVKFIKLLSSFKKDTVIKIIIIIKIGEMSSPLQVAVILILLLNIYYKKISV